MFQGFDHLILNVSDVVAAAADFARAGFTVIERSDVPKTATASRFIVFPDRTYIMLIEVRPEAAQTHRLRYAVARGEGWADYSLWADSVDAEAERLRAAGVGCTDPKTVGHEMIDGRSWAVRLAFSGRGAGQSAIMPFLAEDKDDRTLRAPGGPAELTHANGARSIAGITLVAADAAHANVALKALLGVAETVAPQAGELNRSRYMLGERFVDLVQPVDGSSATGKHLAARGEGLFEVHLTTDNRAMAGAIDPALTRSARLNLV